VSAEYGTRYFEWCMSGIDPRVPEVAGPHQLQADDSLLDPTGELYQRAYALIMGRVSYEAMAAHFAPGRTQTDHPWAGIFNAARKVVFSRTLKTDCSATSASTGRSTWSPA